MNTLTSYIVIPARLQSTRLPRKMLLRETGKSLLQHTYEAASKAGRPVALCVATDHDDIVQEVRKFGGNVELTNPIAASGTDRVAEIAAKAPHIDIFVNVQGDEPDIEPEAIDQVVTLLESCSDASVATLATPIRDRQILLDHNCVKVVCDASSRALYFSRSPIPHARDWNDQLLQASPPLFLLHMGIYAYRREYLLELTNQPVSRLEAIEKLEQLRVLEGGGGIVVGLRDHATPGIDTPEDYRAFVSRAAQR